jgi:hypothetical protein
MQRESKDGRFGRFSLRESEDLSQGTDNNDVANPTLLAGGDFDPLDNRASQTIGSLQNIV